jgi:hypothetical protein
VHYVHLKRQSGQYLYYWSTQWNSLTRHNTVCYTPCDRTLSKLLFTSSQIKIQIKIIQTLGFMVFQKPTSTQPFKNFCFLNPKAFNDLSRQSKLPCFSLISILILSSYWDVKSSVFKSGYRNITFVFPSLPVFAPCPIHLLLNSQAHNVWYRHKLWSSIIVQVSPFSCHFLPLRYKYSPHQSWNDSRDYCQLLITEAWVQSQVNPCGICDR